VEWHPLSELQASSDEPLVPPMATLQILGGRKEKFALATCWRAYQRGRL